METPRAVTLTIRLLDGGEQTVTLREDSPEVLALFSALANPGAGSKFMQLPLDDGRVAFSFQTSQVVSIVSEPPVVLKVEAGPEGAPTGQAAGQVPKDAQGPSLRRARFVVIDDFVSLREHDALLACALGAQAHFQTGAVTAHDPVGGKQLVMADFAQSIHGRALANRLLMWFPLLARTLGLRMFPLAPVEAELTAAMDGHHFKYHGEETASSRGLACLYYLHRSPRGFAGGELLLHDSVEGAGARRAAETFTAVTPVANRLVVFPSEEFHEAMPVRCPSGEFADSPFAVAIRLRRVPRLDPAARFGWGHFRCGVVAPQFAFAERGETE